MITNEETVSIESEIASLLDEMCDAQEQLLKHLDRKFDALKRRDLSLLSTLQADEQMLLDRLSHCQSQRNELVDKANQSDLAGKDLAEITQALPAEKSLDLKQKIAETRKRSGLLKHKGLTNWILAQRSLVHVTQILEIIATGGKMRPTYQKRDSASEPLSIDRRA
jgi:hypothetical protein